MTTRNDRPTCRDCRFFQGGNHRQNGRCHANPPVIVDHFGKWSQHVRPKVKASDLACRFYQQRNTQ